MPTPVVTEWLTQRDTWLRCWDIDPSRHDWQTQLQQLPPSTVIEFKKQLSERWNEQLDALHGQCVLARPNLARIVGDSFEHFNGDRYLLTDYVIMPNHVHLLAAFPDEQGMLRQCESWKHFTARQINHALQRKGRFWQQDGFDHLVRSEEDLEHYRNYIADNPIRAHLKPDHFLHYSNPSYSSRSA